MMLYLQALTVNNGTTYAENSRETFRKQAMHRFRTAALIEDNGKATNSPNYRYRITDETLSVLKAWGGSNAEKQMNRFLAYHDKLVDIYASKKKMTMMPVKINGADFQFSVGKHNELQKAIIEEFAPRFAPGSECLYVGDTIEKILSRMWKNSKDWDLRLHSMIRCQMSFYTVRMKTGYILWSL